MCLCSSIETSARVTWGPCIERRAGAEAGRERGREGGRGGRRGEGGTRGKEGPRRQPPGPRPPPGRARGSAAPAGGGRWGLGTAGGRSPPSPCPLWGREGGDGCSAIPTVPGAPLSSVGLGERLKDARKWLEEGGSLPPPALGWHAEGRAARPGWPNGCPPELWVPAVEVCLGLPWECSQSRCCESMVSFPGTTCLNESGVS